MVKVVVESFFWVKAAHVRRNQKMSRTRRTQYSFHLDHDPTSDLDFSAVADTDVDYKHSFLPQPMSFEHLHPPKNKHLRL